MIRQAFLRSSEGIFTLAPKLTVIGRDSCDFIIQNITVDAQQAVIEYLENEDCFVLKDLNSTHGTYVNECRVQNASVRLAEGDVLRFGFSSGQYEFHSEECQQQQAPLQSEEPLELITASQKSQWQPPPPPLPPQSQTPSLPQIPHHLPPTHRHTVAGGGLGLAWAANPRPPSTTGRLTRPQSASVLNKRCLTPSAPTQVPSGASLSNTAVSSRKSSISGPTRLLAPEPRIVTQVEETRMTSVQRELERLRLVEQECAEKTRLLDELSQYSTNFRNGYHSQEEQQQQDQCEEDAMTGELQQKQFEIERLHQQLQKKQQTGGSNSNNNQELLQQARELEKTRKDLQISYGLVSSLQRDLSSRDEVAKKAKRDLEQMSHELTEKEITVSSIMAKLTKFKDVEYNENEKKDREREIIGLRHKLSAAEVRLEELTDQLDCARRRLEELQAAERANAERVRQLEQKTQQDETNLRELQSAEAVLRIDVQDREQKYERLRNRIMQVTVAIPGFDSGSEESMKDDQMVEAMKELLQTKIEHDRRMCEQQKAFDMVQRRHKDFVEELIHLNGSVKQSFDFLSNGEHSSSRIREAVMMLKATDFADNEIMALRDLTLANLEAESRFQAGVEDCVAQAAPDLAHLPLTECFRRLIQRCVDTTENKRRTDSQMEEARAEFEREGARLKNLQEELIEQRVQEAVDKQRFEDAEALKKALEELKTYETENRKTIERELNNKVKELEDNLMSLNARVEDADAAILASQDRQQTECQERDGLRVQVAELTGQLQADQATIAELERSVCEQLTTAETQWQAEIELYRQETSQHALTIESLNSRLQKMDRDAKELHNQVTRFKVENKKLSEKSQSFKSPKETHGQNVEYTNANNIELANMERCVAGLRHENAALKSKLREQGDTIKGLNMDVSGAEARLSDLKGELSETQKTELDQMKIETEKLEEEVNELRIQLSQMSGIIDGLNQEVDDKKMEINTLKQQCEEFKLLVQEKEMRVSDLEMKANQDNENWNRQLNHIEQEGRLSGQLAALGSQCRGERHVQVIEAQRSALSELRHKLKTMELTKMANSSVPEMAQQMIQLKKELAEMRAKQAMKDGAPYGVASLSEMMQRRAQIPGGSKPMLALTPAAANTNVTADQREAEEQRQRDHSDVQRARQKLEFDVKLLGNQLEDTKQNFEYSETAYTSLMRNLMTSLDVENLPGLRSFDNLTSEAKHVLRGEREQSCGMLVQKVKILHERVLRKEELLHSYERDLVKLRQAEDLATRSQEQLDQIIQQMRDKAEEVDLLRETLNRTKDLLSQEKRTNGAIKQNKNYVPDKSVAVAGGGRQKPMNEEETNKYHCPPPDVLDREKSRDKAKQDKLRRKDYEIKTLKTELCRKEKELTHATNRLYSLETTMGIKSTDEPVS